MRALSAIIAAAIGLVSQSALAGLSLDGSVVTGKATNASSMTTGSLTTSGGAGIVLVFATASHRSSDGCTSGGAVSSVTGGGLTFSPRVGTGGAMSPIQYVGAEAGEYNDIEEWWAYYSSNISSGTFTVSYNSCNGHANFDTGAVIALAVTGQTGTSWHTAPFDGNASLPATGSNTVYSNPSVSGVSATSANGFVVSYGTSGDNELAPTTSNIPASPGTWTFGAGVVDIDSSATSAGLAYQNFQPSSASIAWSYASNGSASIVDDLIGVGTSSAAPTDVLLMGVQ